MRSGIVLSGTMILDIVHLINRWPDQDSVAIVDRNAYGAGGPPHNAGAGLKKLGANFPITIQGVVGNDAYGDIFCAQAQSYGLNTDHIIHVPNATTSHTQVMTVMTTGRRTFFHQPGVNAVMTTQHLLPKSADAKIFYVGSPGIAHTMDETDGWLTLLKVAKAQGFITALELVPVSSDVIAKEVPKLLPHTDICVINDSEAAALVGFPVTSGDNLNWAEATRACQRLFELGVGDVAAIHHPQGAVALRRSGEQAKAFSVNVPQSEIIGTVGAGDAFYAGMLFGLHENWPLEKCLELANATAATSLHSATTSASIRPCAECLDYARAKGLRG